MIEYVDAKKMLSDFLFKCGTYILTCEIFNVTSCIWHLKNMFFFSYQMYPVTQKPELSDTSSDPRKMDHHGDCPLTVHFTFFFQQLFSVYIAKDIQHLKCNLVMW